jgi:membrane protein
VTNEPDERGAEPDRGREAARPGDIPASGWKDVFSRVKQRASADDLPLTAAGAAFYALLATFPGLLAALRVHELLFDPEQQSQQLAFLQDELQPQAIDLFVALLRGLAASDRSHMGLGVAGGALVTLWGASLGVRALMNALNVAYDEQETRSAVRRYALALLLTTGAIAVVFCMGLVVIGPFALSRWLDLGPPVHRVALLARWPAVALMFWLSLLVLYRYGPSRTHARWSWVSWGALIATALWLSASGILAWYVANSPRFHQAFGSVGLIVLALIWFLVSAFSVLLGAEINAELERQTRRDTTVGAERAAGQRGARAADDLGASAS